MIHKIMYGINIINTYIQIHRYIDMNAIDKYIYPSKLYKVSENVFSKYNIVTHPQRAHDKVTDFFKRECSEN